MRVFYHVAPRYSAGSPAQVPEGTARVVAKQEELSHAKYLAGAYGYAAMKEAKELGLGGIVYSSREKGRAMLVEDLITKEKFKVPIQQWGTGEGDQRYWYARQDRNNFLVGEP